MLWNKKKETISDAVVITDHNFKEFVTDSDIPVFLDFWAPWYGPCKIIGPIIDELATDFKGRVMIGKVNVDQNPHLSQFFKIKSIPTLMFVKNGRLVERMSQLIPKPNLEEMLNDLIDLDVPPREMAETPSNSEEE